MGENVLDGALQQHAATVQQHANTFTKILEEYARSKIQQLEITNYNGANLAYNHGADMANKLKLTEAQKLGVTPFPCPTNTNVQVNPDTGIRELAKEQETWNNQVEALRDELGKAQEAVKGNDVVEEVPKRKGWIAPIVSALGGAGTVGAALMAYNAIAPQEIPTANSPDPHYDSSIGLEVEGVVPWKTNSQ